MTKIERLTSQKKVILDYLKNVKTHPSADRIYSAVKKKLPRISRGTVYRILKGFEKKGDVLEIHCKDCHRYDADMSDHAHFLCEKCKRIYDVFKRFNLVKSKKLNVGTIKSGRVFFYGTCNRCGKKKK